RNQLRVPKCCNKKKQQDDRHKKTYQHDANKCEPSAKHIVKQDVAVILPREKFWVQFGRVEATLHGQCCNAQRSLPCSGRTIVVVVRCDGRLKLSVTTTDSVAHQRSCNRESP